MLKEDNELLTQTSAGRPMGDLMRQYWIPALISEEIPDRDGPPVQVRLLGERLIAFRDTDGRIGLLEEACSHRGTSLFYGRNEECGLRCIYHGWKYDVHGHVLETPAEPADSTFKSKLKHRAYPTHEVGGIVFAYLGPSSTPPLFPNYEWANAAPDHLYVTKSLLECNWLQGLEGECDNSHLEYLHREARADKSVREMKADNPIWEWEETDFGLRYVTHRPRPDGAENIGVKSFVLPCSAYLGTGLASQGLGYEVHTYVPADDLTTWRYDFGHIRPRPAQASDVHRRIQIGPDYRRVRTQSNHYLQDRALQRDEDYTGIEDFLNEDACVTETMGSIMDRRREHLGTSDQAIIAVRHYLLNTVRTFQTTGAAPHIVTDPELNDYRHADALAANVPGGDWHAFFPHLVKEARQLADVSEADLTVSFERRDVGTPRDSFPIRHNVALEQPVIPSEARNP
ncbi:MAG TPA: Rieske 2Fe-2S domain-containing protein [Chloroflexota bacterium]